MVQVDGAGGYVPRYRIQRSAISEQHGDPPSSGETAVPARDETPLTMAVEAAGTALERAAVDAADLGAVLAASVTDRYAEHGVAAQVAYRYGATGAVRTGDFGGTTRAGSDALAAGWRHVEATGEPALVVAGDVMPVEPGHDDEPYSGAAAGAVVLRSDASAPLADCAGIAHRTTGFVERHREHGAAAVHGDGRYEGEYGFGEAVSEVVASLYGEGVEPTHAAIAVPDQRMARGAIETFPADVARVSTFGGVGYAGAATYLLDLVAILERCDVGTEALAVSYGQGGADAVALEVTGTPREGPTIDALVADREDVTYARHLSAREPLESAGVSVE